MKRTAFVILAAAGLALTGCSHDDRPALMALEDKLIDGLGKGNIDRIMECYIQDESLVVFDVVPPRQYMGAKAYRKDWADFMAMAPGGIRVEPSDRFVEASGDIGYGHMIVHVSFTAKDGTKLEHTARMTDVYRKIGGNWLIVHEHASWPAEFPSGKADLNSRP